MLGREEREEPSAEILHASSSVLLRSPPISRHLAGGRRLTTSASTPTGFLLRHFLSIQQFLLLIVHSPSFDCVCVYIERERINSSIVTGNLRKIIIKI